MNTGIKPLCSVKFNFLTPCTSVLNSVLVDVKTLQSCETVTSNSAFFQVLEVFKALQILISNFCRVLNAILCLLGNLPASELLMPTFRNLLAIPSS